MKRAAADALIVAVAISPAAAQDTRASERVRIYFRRVKDGWQAVGLDRLP